MSRNIFPESVSTSPKDKEMREMIDTFYSDVMDQNSSYQAEANIDSLLEAGDQRALCNLGFSRVLPQMDMYTQNKIKRQVNAVSGIQRKGRMSTKAIPKGGGSDQKTADQFTKLLFDMNNNSNVLHVISDAFQSSITTGLSLIQLWVDYRDDPISGDIKTNLCPYNSFIIDPYFKQPDLSDCRAVWKRSYLAEDEVKSLLPEHKSEITKLAIGGSVTDDIFPYLQSSYWNKSNFMSYDEYFYLDHRNQRKLIDTATGEVIEYTGQDDKILPIFLKENPSVILKEVDVPTVKLAILVNGHVFYDGLNPVGTDKYPFVPVFGYFSQEITDMNLKFQGLVRGMRDSQFLYNLMTSLEVEFIQSRVNPGTVYKPTDMINPKNIEQRDLSGNFPLKKHGDVHKSILFVAPPEIPQSLALVREQAGKEIVENDGGNEELMGTASEGNISGFLSRLRAAAGKSGYEGLFDHLDLSQQILGQRQLEIMQSNYTPGKVQRIIEEQPTDQFYNKTFGKYDAAIEEGLNTTTQRQQQFSEMLLLNQQTDIQIPAEFLVKASTLQNKQELIDFMDNVAKQEQQATEQEQQVNQQLQQAEIELATAKSHADNALAIERTSRVEDNRTQAITNLAEAEKDKEQATLNKTKALKELEEMDLSNLQRTIDLINVVKASEVQQEQQLAAQAAPAQATGGQATGGQATNQGV